MKHFFILGSNPTLSLAELQAVFGLTKNDQVTNNIAILDNQNISEAEKLISRLGGTIKIGRILGLADNHNLNNILTTAKNLIMIQEQTNKFKFGFSYYGQKKINLKILGMEFKKYLKERGLNSRWVTSREPILSSVVVEQNKLISQGVEICLIPDENNLLIGQTLAVQPFKELSFRDYGRPARDDLSGMLPPKLAQIMINLAAPSPYQGEGRGGVILDPFCGSGTILTEAMLMGFKNLIGTDISAKAITDTEQNINWIKLNFQLSTFNFQLFNKPTIELPKILKPNSVDAIVTEPYLGPQRGRFDYFAAKKELEKLYSDSLAVFKKIIKPGGRVVMVWPVFRFRDLKQTISPRLNDFKIISPLPKNFLNQPGINLTERQTIIYGRPEQKIWREIVILE